MGAERPGVPPWSLAIAAMFSVQLGSALSTHLIDTVGPAGTAWLRLTAGGIIFLAIARPPLRSLSRRDLPVLVGLGITTGLQTMAFLAAIERIPLGTSVAIEFLGPMVVAAVHSHRRRSLVWVGLAGIGVVLVTQPWDGTANLAGVWFAALAAVGWAAYILLTKKVGERFSGVSGLAITIPIAAIVAACVGVPRAAGHLTMGIGAAAIGLAILLPVIPYAFELLALRRMPPTAFGTLMALEPAFGVVLGLVILHQRPSFSQLVGMLLVVAAGVAAQRAERRPGDPGDLERDEPSTGPSPF